MVLEPTETGIFRGVCAEYCGASHALMAFGVEVMEPDAFEAWLAAQAAPAAPPESAPARAGRDRLLAAGCGACHTIRGTPANGRIGPDLTHVGSRLTLGAGILPNEVDAFVRWVGFTDQVKPGVHMPSFGALGEEDLTAIGVYLESLQ
jgi:cytochrome c oxidase subunit 2